MSLLQRKDGTALEILYDRHHRLALALAYRIVGDRDGAEDVVQEAFLAVWRRAESYRPDLGRVQAWLLSIVRHRAIDRVRRRRTQGLQSELSESWVDADAPDVMQIAERGIERDRLIQAVATLSTEQRQVIELAYYGGLTHSEIAEATSLPLGTVKGRIRLAMEKLRTELVDLAPEALES